MLTTFRIRLIAAIIAASTWSATTVRAGSPVYVGPKAVHQMSMDQIDHSAWDALLKKHVDSDGYVNYRSWKASSADTDALNRYLATLTTANPNVAASREAKLAFWINAYNAVTVHGILREYPTTSIRNHTAKVFGYNIWHDLQLHVGGTPFSLDSIEHQILRKMNEPSIHFAIVCASIGCPRLLNEAYVADRVKDQLELNAKDFFNRKQNFQYDAGRQTFAMSSIMDWFGADFGSNQAEQLKRIAPWLPSAAAQSAATRNAVSIRHLDYNWNLNERR